MDEFVEIEPYQEIVKVHWTDLAKGHHSTAVHPDMFSAEGYEILKMCKLKGASHHDAASEYLVHYDRAFVVRKLVNLLRFSARSLTVEDFMCLFDEIWKECNKSDD